MNLLVSFVFIGDESVTSCFNQKYRESFYSYEKNNCLVTTLYEVSNRLQEFFFFGNQRGNQKKTHFALFGSTGFPALLRIIEIENQKKML